LVNVGEQDGVDVKGEHVELLPHEREADPPPCRPEFVHLVVVVAAPQLPLGPSDVARRHRRVGARERRYAVGRDHRVPLRVHAGAVCWAVGHDEPVLIALPADDGVGE